MSTTTIVLAYLGIGGVFARLMAISPQAVVVLVLLWPLFGVLIVLSPLINWWVNREFRS